MKKTMENKNELPKMTIEQRNTIVNPIIGLEIIDSDTNELMRFDGIEFVRINNHKQEAIKKAYGEYYDICKPDEDGWCSLEIGDFDELYSQKIQYIVGYWRPFVLNNIEHNNKWVRFEEKLPEMFSNIDCYDSVKDLFVFNVALCSEIDLKQAKKHYTHWKPYNQPPKPIY